MTLTVPHQAKQSEVTKQHAFPESEHIEALKPKQGIPESDEIEQTDAGAYVWLVALTASIGGMLFGYDTGIISAVLMITSLCSAGSFLGAIIAGLTADKYGRKGPMYVGCALFTIGAILQASAYSVPQMAVGRLIVGLGVGSAAMIVPAYIAEIAPMKYRGRMVGLNNVSITGGQVISYAIGAAFASVPHGWRYMVGLGGVPSILLAILLPLCPESPRQLISHGKVEEAANVLHRIFSNASEEQVSAKIQLISETVQEAQLSTQGRSRWDIVKELHKNPAHFRALVCACGLIGFSNPVAVSLVVSGTNMVSACINMLLVDPVGRRRLLVSTAWGMAAGLLAVAISFVYIPVNLDTLEVQDNTITPPAIVVLVFIIWFVAFYGVSIGNTAWMSADFFSTEVRAIGTMYMTCCCWGSNLIVSSTFLSMMKGITPSGAFGFYAGLCFVGWILIIFFYPEMSGLTLEESQEVFQHGFGVRYARQLRKDRRRGGE
ncbi:major facilitator superfamily domain-containing protein [Aspergillus parasiticus]|uniref:Major facilitator superfamily domain-containing protein n=1 Tax=Aspergillus parasiticus TaxID=5067 RepID=A0A5N6DCM0_ASPPA|nr:major facilitator superfamily domain-containing protein [Aspergillus parasiticus]